MPAGDLKLKPLKRAEIPLYLQVRDLVLNKILAQEWLPGRKLAADRVLSRELQVNHITLGKALNMLRSEGYLIRYPGHGTFVADPLPRSQPPAAGGNSRRVVGVLFDSVGEQTFLTDLFISLFTSLDSNELSLQLASARNDPEEQYRQILDFMADEKVAGCMVWSIMSERQVKELMKKRRPDFPVIFLDRYPNGVVADWSGYDDYAAGYYLGEAMRAAGLSRSWLVQADFEAACSTVRRRFAGYKDAFQGELGELTLESLVHSGLPDCGKLRPYLLRLAEKTTAPVALFAASDPVAIGIYAELSADPVLQRHFRLCYVQTQHQLPVSRVQMDLKGMGRSAVDLLIRRLEGSSEAQLIAEAPCRLEVVAAEPAQDSQSSRSISPDDSDIASMSPRRSASSVAAAQH